MCAKDINLSARQVVITPCESESQSRVRRLIPDAEDAQNSENRSRTVVEE